MVYNKRSETNNKRFINRRKRRMKTLVIGGVAAGTKAAAKLKREDRNAEVTLITKSGDIETMKKSL